MPVPGVAKVASLNKPAPLTARVSVDDKTRLAPLISSQKMKSIMKGSIPSTGKGLTRQMISPEVAAFVVKEYLLPMFESQVGGGKQSKA